VEGVKRRIREVRRGLIGIVHVAHVQSQSKHSHETRREDRRYEASPEKGHYDEAPSPPLKNGRRTEAVVLASSVSCPASHQRNAS